MSSRKPKVIICKCCKTEIWLDVDGNPVDFPDTDDEEVEEEQVQQPEVPAVKKEENKQKDESTTPAKYEEPAKSSKKPSKTSKKVHGKSSKPPKVQPRKFVFESKSYDGLRVPHGCDPIYFKLVTAFRDDGIKHGDLFKVE